MTKKLPRSRIDALAAASPDTLIRIYTYHDPQAWRDAQERGYFTGESAPSEGDCNRVWYKVPYEWMRTHMAATVPDFSGDLPVWAWTKRLNRRREKWASKEVRITALVPRRRIVFSDYDLWHVPLNNGPVTFSEAEDDSWYQAPKLVHLREGLNVQDTWHHVFDLKERSQEHASYLGVCDRVQVCVDRIYLDEIVGVRHFKSSARS